MIQAGLGMEGDITLVKNTVLEFFFRFLHLFKYQSVVNFKFNRILGIWNNNTFSGSYFAVNIVRMDIIISF